jgi:hypothetical protein
MVKMFIISFFLISSVLFFAVTNWFENEQIKVNKITKKHLNDIRRLRKIAKINQWMDKIVKPSLDRLKSDVESTDNDLVDFYDKYSQQFNFRVSKYIYTDVNTQNLDIKFSILRDDISILKELTSLKHKSGFLHFNSFDIDDKSIKGELQIVQPYYGDKMGDKNAS